MYSFIGPDVTADQIWTDDGVIRWKSNNSVPPDECLDNMISTGLITIQDAVYSKTVRSAEQEKFFAEYRERMKDWEPSDEERYEARSAHGPGVELVNVITGKRWTT